MAKTAKGPTVINEGTCGFKGCSDLRLTGVWFKEGSLMCAKHREVIAAIRVMIEEDDDPYDTRERAALRQQLVGITEDDPEEYTEEELQL